MYGTRAHANHSQRNSTSNPNHFHQHHCECRCDCSLHNMMQDVHTALHEPATDPFTSFTESPSSARSPVYTFCRLRTSCTCSDGSFLCTSSTDVQTPSWDLMWLSVRLHVTMRLGFTYIRLIS